MRLHGLRFRLKLKLKRLQLSGTTTELGSRGTLDIGGRQITIKSTTIPHEKADSITSKTLILEDSDLRTSRRGVLHEGDEGLETGKYPHRLMTHRH